MYSEEEVQKMIELEVSKIQSPKRENQETQQTEPEIVEQVDDFEAQVVIKDPVTPSEIKIQTLRNPRSISVKRLDPEIGF